MDSEPPFKEMLPQHLGQNDEIACFKEGFGDTFDAFDLRLVAHSEAQQVGRRILGNGMVVLGGEKPVVFANERLDKGSPELRVPFLWELR